MNQEMNQEMNPKSRIMYQFTPESSNAGPYNVDGYNKKLQKVAGDKSQKDM